MRYAIVADIHANLPAWNTVLTDLASLRVDRIVCLGDIVGYGPEPAAVLASVYRHVDGFCLGNHDAVVAGKLDAGLFNDRARAAIAWTAGQLGARAAGFLGGMPLTLTGPGFRCAHGDFAAPAAFRYVIEPTDALASWQAVPEPLLFVGHSHVPALFVLGASGVPHRIEAQDFVLEEGKRFLVAAGSVGHPRDRDARACYCIYDTADSSVRWRRVAFDLDACRAAYARTGQDPGLAPYLQRDPRQTRPPLREMLNFAPANTPAQEARGVVATGDLARLRRRLGRWRMLTFLLAAVVLAGLSAAAVLTWHAQATRTRWTPATPPPPRALVAAQHALGNQVPALPDEIAPDGQLGGWRLGLQAPRAQRIGIEQNAEGHAVLVVRAAQRTRFCFEAPAIEVHGVSLGKAQASGLFRRSPDFEGHVELVLDVEERDEQGRLRRRPGLICKPPTLERKQGWMLAQQTTDANQLARVATLRFAVEGEFSGQLELADLALSFK